MTGFDLGDQDSFANTSEKVKWRNQMGLLSSAIRSAVDVQFVLIDHPSQPGLTFAELPNLTCDKLQNVLQLLT
jgi:hypothetical protein